MLLKLLEYRWQLNIFSVYSITISLINMKSILFRKLAGCTNEVWNVSFCAMEMKLRKSWSPSANTISGFRGSLEWSAQGNVEYFICAALRKHLQKYNFNIKPLLHKKSTIPNVLLTSKTVLSKWVFRGSNPGHPD